LLEISTRGFSEIDPGSRTSKLVSRGACFCSPNFVMTYYYRGTDFPSEYTCTDTRMRYAACIYTYDASLQLIRSFGGGERPSVPFCFCSSVSVILHSLEYAQRVYTRIFARVFPRTFTEASTRVLGRVFTRLLTRAFTRVFARVSTGVVRKALTIVFRRVFFTIEYAQEYSEESSLEHSQEYSKELAG